MSVQSDSNARLAVDLLKYLETPDSTNARRLKFAASNKVALFARDVRELDRYTLPLVSLSERYYGADIERFDAFMVERNKRFERMRAMTNQNIR